MQKLKIKTNTAYKALIIGADGIYPDSEVCSSIPDLGGQPCPHSKNGCVGDPMPLDPNDPLYTIDKGKPGDLCPPCAKQQLGNLGHWQGHGKQYFPEELLSLRLFKCRMWFWFVVMGLYDNDPTILKK